MGKELINKASAHETSVKAEKLLNVISRQIKEESEFGKCRTCLSFTDLALGVEELIVKCFTNLGFTVNVKHEVNENKDSDGDVIFESDITFFIFSW